MVAIAATRLHPTGPTMLPAIRSRQLAALALYCLLPLTAAMAAAQTPDTAKPTAPVDAAGRPGVALPPGWMVLHLPSLNGHFRAVDSNDNALLVYRETEGLSGLVVVTFTPDGGQASMVKTFPDDNVNAPVLSLIEPGDYQPACHPGTPCEKVHIEHQAIGLHFGEASAAIIYFDGKQYRDIAVTD
jgi:hypothetical protein